MRVKNDLMVMCPLFTLVLKSVYVFSASFVTVSYIKALSGYLLRCPVSSSGSFVLGWLRSFL